MPERQGKIMQPSSLQIIRNYLDDLNDAEYAAAIEREPALAKLIKDMNYERKREV